MDKESWFVVIGLIIIESVLFSIYFKFPFNLMLTIPTAIVIIFGADRIEKYLQLNNGSSTV